MQQQENAPVAYYPSLAAAGAYFAQIGTTLRQLRDNFDTTFGQLWDNIGTTLRQIWDNYETALALLWDNFRTTLRPQGDYV